MTMAGAEYPTAQRFTCPCCGSVVFDETPGSYEICPVCFWEDDCVQLRWPDWATGANKPSLIEGQHNFQTFGACEQRLVKHVRPASESESADPGWYPLGTAALHFFEPEGEQSRPWPTDRTVLYWWRPTFWRTSPPRPTRPSADTQPETSE